MIYRHFTKEQIEELGIEDAKQIFGCSIAIFKHKTGVVLFTVLDDEKYKVHPASHTDFIDIHKKHLDLKNTKIE